jgi:hypothetical protein
MEGFMVIVSNATFNNVSIYILFVSFIDGYSGYSGFLHQ